MILTLNRNIWRLEGSRRAAVLIDGANYFGALREALLQARSTVFIIGWDLDSRTRLVDESGQANDGYPEGFADFLTVLVNERPQLTVHLLVWDYSVLYALEREPFPTIHWVGARHGASAFAWTKTCRLAQRIIKRLWWLTTRSLFAGAST